MNTIKYWVGGVVTVVLARKYPEVLDWFFVRLSTPGDEWVYHVGIGLLFWLGIVLVVSFPIRLLSWLFAKGVAWWRVNVLVKIEWKAMQKERTAFVSQYWHPSLPGQLWIIGASVFRRRAPKEDYNRWEERARLSLNQEFSEPEYHRGKKSR